MKLAARPGSGLAALALAALALVACGRDALVVDDTFGIPPDGGFAGGSGAGAGGKPGAGGSGAGGSGAGATGGTASSGPGAILVNAQQPLYTSEDGDDAEFYVRLDRPPLGVVRVPIFADDNREVRLGSNQLVFNEANWDLWQTVFVFGLDDRAFDGDRKFAIQIGPARSGDPAFDGIQGLPVLGVNRDDEATMGRHLLYVVGDDTLLQSGEEVVLFRLESRNFAVTTITGGFAQAADAVGKAAVLLSGVSPAQVINTTFRDVATPIVAMDANLFDDLAMTGPTPQVHYGTGLFLTELFVVQPGHPMAAGLVGTTRVTFNRSAVGWGNVTTGVVADIVAVANGRKEQAVLFGYPRGGRMFGHAAPSARVGYAMSVADAANFTEEGIRLLDGAVDWAIANR